MPEVDIPTIRFGGSVDRLRDGVIAGWAVVDDGRVPCFVNISVDGRLLARVEANRFRPDLLAKGIHPNGHAGFRCAIGDLPPGAKVRCVIDGVGCDLTRSPMVVPGAVDAPRER